MGLVPVSGERESGKEGRAPSYWLYSCSIYAARSTVPILGSGKGERLSLSASRTTCTEGGTDHGHFLLQDELSDLQHRTQGRGISCRPCDDTARIAKR